MVGLREVWVDPDCVAPFGDRLLQLPVLAQGGAEARVGHGVGALDPDRCAQFDDRMVYLTAPAETRRVIARERRRNTGKWRGLHGPWVWPLSLEFTAVDTSSHF